MTENEIATVVVDAAYKVHVTLGPGLLESVYSVALAHELGKRNLAVIVEQSVPVIYDGIQIANGYRADMVVEDKVIVLFGNLIIQKGGSLTLRNTTLKLSCHLNGSNYIYVRNGGSLLIYDKDNDPTTVHDGSIITSYNLANNTRFNFCVFSGALFEMKNSELRNCGYKWYAELNEGLYIETDNSVIENCTFLL